jgi:O-succinylbenzoate synthase
LRLDANGAWSRRQAERWLKVCAERPLEFVEQPLAPADADGLLGLARDYPVKLALDESVTRLAAAREWQARGWPGVFVLKPALGGPLEETAAWIRETRADVVLSSALETALGRTAILRWALAHDITKRALGFGVGGLFGDPCWDGPAIGPLLDPSWGQSVNAEELWNELS